MPSRKPPKNSLAALAVSGVALYVQCKKCKHHRPLHYYSLMLKVGWRATIREIETRHRCSRCGAKAAEIRRH